MSHVAAEVGCEGGVHLQLEAGEEGRVEAAVESDVVGVVEGVVAADPGEAGQRFVGHLDDLVAARHEEVPVAGELVKGGDGGVGGGNGEKDAGDFDINDFCFCFYIEISDHPGIAVVTTLGDWRKAVAAVDDYSSCSNGAAYINLFSIGAGDGVTVLFGTVWDHSHNMVPPGFTDVEGDAGALCEGVAHLQNRQVHRRGEFLRGARKCPRGSCHAEEHQRQEQDVFCKCLFHYK